MPEIPVESPADLNIRFEVLKPKICQTETEDSWEVIFRSLKALADLCQSGGACEFPAELITIIRSISRPITNSLITERTRLSSVAVDLISVLATGLGKSFKPLLQVFLPTLLSLCGRTNKVIVNRVKACIIVIIETTQLSAIISYFVQSIEDKSISVRLAAAEGTLICVNCFNPPDLERDARASEVETIIRAAAKDAQADIRAVGRKLFEAYKVLLPKRVESFAGPLSPTTKKYLDIKAACNAQSETSHAAISHIKNQFSSSTSAISSTCGRTESTHPVVHARSVSSSTLPIDGRVKSNTASTKTPTTKKTEMLPPAFIPVRPYKKGVPVTHSTSAAETRPPVVSTTLPLRAGEISTDSHQPHSLPARPNSALSYREVPQRLHPQPSAPSMSGSSGPRRVPIAGAGVKAEKTSARMQAPVVRSRIVSNPNGAPKSDVKVTITRAPQVSVRANPKVTVKMRDAHPPMSSRAPTSTITSKSSKTGSVTQPTLSQISRAKATAEQKQTNTNPPKSRGHTTKAASSSISDQRGTQKGKPKLTDTGVKKPIQPATIPLPPSPTPSSPSDSEDGEEPAPLTNTPDMVLHFQAELVAAHSQPIQNEDVTPPVVIQTHDVHDKIDTEGQAEQHDKENEAKRQETTERLVEEHTSPIEHPTTPTILSTDDIFDTNAKTPISSLLASIQRGFMFTPSSPLSPPQSYANRCLEMAIPFPLVIDGPKTDENAKERVKPSTSEIGNDYGRSTLSSVENLEIHK
ncbi:Protein stu1 [Termitomyces sp. T112]|nr:Protein stu1 [Termitomyces sp. T112]